MLTLDFESGESGHAGIINMDEPVIDPGKFNCTAAMAAARMEKIVVIALISTYLLVAATTICYIAVYAGSQAAVYALVGNVFWGCILSASYSLVSKIKDKERRRTAECSEQRQSA